MKMKNCPFCGNEPELWKHEFQSKISCGKCDAEICGDTEVVMESWNKRIVPIEWISVEERLPEFTGDVILVTGLLKNGNKVEVTKYLNAFWHYNKDVITHWMDVKSPSQRLKGV